MGAELQPMRVMPNTHGQWTTWRRRSMYLYAMAWTTCSLGALAGQQLRASTCA